MKKLDAKVRAVLSPVIAEDELVRVLSLVREELSLTVGRRLATLLTDAELADFEKIHQRQDDGGAYAWLRTHVPEHPRIVDGEIESILARLEVIS